jgi:all-trans-retinol 13,14-reductase
MIVQYIFGFFGLLITPILINNFIKKLFYSNTRLTGYTTNYISDSDTEDFTRNRYTRAKVPKDIDIIVIGSGIGGLTTGALLAKAGKKVLVLEQHYIAGGTTHSFEDKGVEHETGLHYIGNIEKRKPILDLVCHAPIEWCKLGWEREDDRFVYDEIFIGDKHYEFEAGEKNLFNYLMKRFPETNKLNLLKYFRMIKRAAKKDMFFISKIIPFKFMAKLISWWDSEYTYFCETSAYDVVKNLIHDEELIAVLFGQFGDYGMTPKTASFFIHASIVNHYLEGGWFPKGGTGVIANEMCKTIINYGGEVLVAKKVTNILCDNNDAFGVKMENGDNLFAENIISAVGVRNTFHKLMKKNKYPKIYDTMLDKMPPSVQHMYCFVKLDGSPRDLNLRSSNFWIYPHADHDKTITEFLDNPLEAPMPLFMGFSSMKDSNWENKYPGISNAIILAVAKKEWFEEWENTRCMKRGQDYEDFKRQIGERMLEEGLFRFYPELREKVLETNFGTPLSTQFYLNAFGGESYGMDMNLYRLTQSIDLRPRTEINGLFLTGQDICTLGVTGAMMAGVLTANVVAGYDNMTDIVLGNNIVKDLKKV